MWFRPFLGLTFVSMVVAFVIPDSQSRVEIYNPSGLGQHVMAEPCVPPTVGSDAQKVINIIVKLNDKIKKTTASAKAITKTADFTVCN